jgi:hypothetical protein
LFVPANNARLPGFCVGGRWEIDQKAFSKTTIVSALLI